MGFVVKPTGKGGRVASPTDLDEHVRQKRLTGGIGRQRLLTAIASLAGRKIRRDIRGGTCSLCTSARCRSQNAAVTRPCGDGHEQNEIGEVRARGSER